jgi:hypothetical protein
MKLLSECCEAEVVKDNVHGGYTCTKCKQSCMVKPVFAIVKRRDNGQEQKA